MSVFIVVSARMASSRCPGKALASLAGRPLLEVLLDRMAAVRGVDGVVLATSVNAENERVSILYRRREGDYGLIEPVVAGGYTKGGPIRRSGAR